MNLTDIITAEDRRHQKVVERLRAELEAAICDLPDNPRIKRLSKNAFVVNSSDLSGGRWGAESQDFKAQYRAIIGLLDNVPLAQGIERIREALDRQSIRMSADRCSYTLHLHPDVISKVRGLLASV